MLDNPADVNDERNVSSISDTFSANTEADTQTDAQSADTDARRESSEPLSATPDAFLKRPWLSPTDGALLQTDERPLNICKSCNGPVPVDAFTCPTCAKFVKQNLGGRRKHKHDVEKIHAALVEEYEPRTVVLKETCEHLARAYVALKSESAGSLEWHRILNITQQLSANLDASRVAPPVTDCSPLTTDELIDRLEELLTTARTLRDSAPTVAPIDPDADPVGTRRAEMARNDALPTTTPEPKCKYCYQTLTGCAELRSTRPDVFESLHAASPEMVEKRRKIATDTMLRTMLHGSGLTRW